MHLNFGWNQCLVAIVGLRPVLMSVEGEDVPVDAIASDRIY